MTYGIVEPEDYQFCQERRLHNRINTLTFWVRAKIALKYNYTCQICYKQGMIKKVGGWYLLAGEKPHGRPFEVHHIVPLSEGGTHCPFNLILACRKCHKRFLHSSKGRDMDLIMRPYALV